MQISSVFKGLLIASVCLVPSVVAGPLLPSTLEKKEECCDPDFFFPCMIAETVNCNIDNVNLCSYQNEQDCLALCVGIPGATPPLCT